MNNSHREELHTFSKIVKATQGADFGSAVQSSLSRRRFFIAGGATISFGALLAACGGSTTTDIARIGNAPEKTKLVDAPVTDIALLRTATSLEHNAIFVYEAVVAAGLLSGDAAILAARFLSDHQAHAEATASLTEKLGGKAFNEPNPRLQSIYIEPALRLITGDEAKGIPATDDPVADVLALAYALETIAGSTYQVYVPMLADPALRGAAIGIGEQEARHAAVIGSLLNPGRLVSSFGLSIAAEYQEETDVPAAAYAVPTAFGTKAPVPVTLGAANESGIRTSLNLETPSLNSLVYEYLDGE
ncbi:MAG: ferritin-like domain-containing protein [Ilumatobacteraceae bacterium]|jgi:rubrerythrin|nr:ferritin-like domain-containing protein [Ilumatobacteraceae bacterium]